MDGKRMGMGSRMKRKEEYENILKKIDIDAFDGDYRTAIEDFAEKNKIPEDLTESLIYYQEYVDNYDLLTMNVRKQYEAMF
jgi:hypothetical protein